MDEKGKEKWKSTKTWELIEERRTCKTKQKILRTKSVRLKFQLKETYSIQDKEVKKSAWKT